MKTVEQEEANKVDSYSAVSHQKSVRVSRFTSNSDFVSWCFESSQADFFDFFYTGWKQTSVYPIVIPLTSPKTTEFCFYYNNSLSKHASNSDTFTVQYSMVYGFAGTGNSFAIRDPLVQTKL